jgi:hypothetical protein
MKKLSFALLIVLLPLVARKRTTLRFVLVFITCFFLVGCIPYHYTFTPRAFGRVIDSATGAPIAGATIYFEKHPEARTMTDSGGEFDLPQKKGWIWVPLGPFDAAPPGGVLVIEAKGYDTYKAEEFWGSEIKQQVFKLQKTL